MELQSLPLPCLLQSPVLGRGLNSNIPSDMEQNSIVGLRFHPTDHELVYKYLREKLDGVLVDCEDILEINIYDHEPSDLPDFSRKRSTDDVFYFFCAPKYMGKKAKSCKRTTRAGFWKITGNPHIVKHKITKKEIGKKRILVFHHGRDKGIRTEWVMHEYNYTEKCSNGGSSSKSNQGDFVLCKIKKKFDRKLGKSESTDLAKVSFDFTNQNQDPMITDSDLPNGKGDEIESNSNLSYSFVRKETNSAIYRNEDSYAMPSSLGNHMLDRSPSFSNDSTYFHPSEFENQTNSKENQSIDLQLGDCQDLNFEDILNFDFQKIVQEGGFGQFLLSSTNCECLETSTSGDMNQNQRMSSDISTIDSGSDVLKELEAFF